MEQDPKAKVQEPEGVKADVNPAREAENQERISGRDQEVVEVEDRAEAKVVEKVGIGKVFQKNKISNHRLQKDNFLI
jgi:hypothetical protein